MHRFGTSVYFASLGPAFVVIYSLLFYQVTSHSLATLIAFSEYFQGQVFIILVMDKTVIPLFLPDVMNCQEQFP
ncbi:MAG: hypothetical protein A2W90_21555 [Bacteroidetes bacterium GWF2_42_66]|nr:MAG: hypothetical protein A2W92_04370 [Bacteroidetes bacterium GWA2_42_15]OFY45635.1 MAG: hypothetical protein A2W90_21555 [Bacteroidetes bacterium GWF2_42_66]